MSELQQDQTFSLLAGVWFAAASCLPLSPLWVEFLFSPEGRPWHTFLAAVLVYGVLPVVISGVSGLLLGSDILDPVRVATAWRALARGGLVALSSALIYALSLGLFAGVGMSISERLWPGGGGGFNAMLEVLGLFLVGLIGTLVVGLFTLGWIAVIVGAIAGWLLYRCGQVLRERAA